MTAIAHGKCRTKFDWLGKNVEPIKFHITFSAVYVIMKGSTELKTKNGIDVSKKNIDVSIFSTVPKMQNA